MCAGSLKQLIERKTQECLRLSSPSISYLIDLERRSFDYNCRKKKKTRKQNEKKKLLCLLSFHLCVRNKETNEKGNNRLVQRPH